jgi:hypothetical protein
VCFSTLHKFFAALKDKATAKGGDLFPTRRRSSLSVLKESRCRTSLVETEHSVALQTHVWRRRVAFQADIPPLGWGV